MSHKLFRLAASVFNTPQLITASEFRPIVNYLQDRNNLDKFLGNPVYKGSPGKGVDTEELDIFNGVGVVQISGLLTYKPAELLCQESTSYQDLLGEVEDLIEAGVKAVIFECNSGGGEAGHMFTTANEIKRLLSEAGISSIAYVDTLAASACYGLACVCDEIIIHPEAKAGSIGAMIALVDDSKAMEEAGLKEIYITDKPGKVPFGKDGSFKDSFLEKLQEEVDALGAKFNAHVQVNTGISVEEITALDAQVFTAEDCLSKGLVNKIMDHNQFADYVSSKFSN